MCHARGNNHSPGYQLKHGGQLKIYCRNENYRVAFVEYLAMEYKTLRSFFMRFNRGKLFNICDENKIPGEFKKSSTKDHLTRLLAEHTLVGIFFFFSLCFTP